MKTTALSLACTAVIGFINSIITEPEQQCAHITFWRSSSGSQMVSRCHKHFNSLEDIGNVWRVTTKTLEQYESTTKYDHPNNNNWISTGEVIKIKPPRHVLQAMKVLRKHAQGAAEFHVVEAPAEEIPPSLRPPYPKYEIPTSVKEKW